MAPLTALGDSATGFAPAVAEFPITTSDSQPGFIAKGSDGNLWFTEEAANQIGRITKDGSVTEYAIPTADSHPTVIVPGPDGGLWFSETAGDKIGRITTDGKISEYALPTAPAASAGLAVGPDGNLWFTETVANQIGRITPGGQISEFSVPTAKAWPDLIASGPDGNLWFTERDANQIGRITPTGTVTEFPLPSANSGPVGIVAGSDGSLWFPELDGNRIGRITTAGAVTEYPLATTKAGLALITAGPDGNLWFTELAAGQVGRITPTGRITEFPLPSPASLPVGLTFGPDGNLWFVEDEGNMIGRLAADAKMVASPDGRFRLTATPAELAATPPLQVSESDAGSVQLPPGLLAASPVYTLNGTVDPGEVAAVTYDRSALTGLSTYRLSLFASDGNGGWSFVPSIVNPLSGTVFATVYSPGTYVALVNSTQFNDIPKGYWAQDLIDYLLGTDVINGFPDGTFRPDAPITRAQFVKMLVLALGLNPSDQATAFSDVTQDAWFEPYVATGVAEGIVDGVSASSFAPNQIVTRQQMAVLLARALKLTGQGAISFTDSAQIDGWALAGVSRAVTVGIMGGFPDGSFRPAEPATRAQAAKVLTLVIAAQAP